MAVNYKPEKYNHVTPYLVVPDVKKQLEFIKNTFGGIIVEEVAGENGKITHAEIQIGDSIIMVGQARDEQKSMVPALYVYVPDTDKAYRAALDAGAVSTMEPENMFYGDRNSGVKDLHGISWWISTRIEDLTPEELQKRATEFYKKV